MFYADTAVHSKSAIRCGYEFFGPEHILFGTDMPYDDEQGFRFVRQAVEGIEQMEIPESDKKKIFEDNARHLLRLPI
jgi:aminocarboxymuconate-semialdehyde decarboxylase